MIKKLLFFLILIMIGYFVYQAVTSSMPFFGEFFGSPSVESSIE